MNKKPLIYFDKLTQWNVIAIVFYVVFTLVVVFIDTSGSGAAPGTLIAYAGTAQLGGYFFLYKALRNFTMYLVCCGFAVIHVFLYFLFRGSNNLEMVRGNPSPMLINSIILLVLFQVLRYLSLKMQKREFVVPAKGGGKDLFDNKEPSSTDYLFFVIYCISWFGLTYLPLVNK